MLVEQTRTEETSLISRMQINDLPINGRRADQFALLVPGVARSGTFGLLSQGGLNVLPTVSRNNNIGRNTFRLDLRLGRNIKIGERLTTQIVAEGFNVFNHSNWTNYNTTAYIATAPPSTSGVSTPIPLSLNAPFAQPSGDGSQPDGTNARRFQLALRFRF